MSDYPMLISNKLHSFRNFMEQDYIAGICSCVSIPVILDVGSFLVEEMAG